MASSSAQDPVVEPHSVPVCVILHLLPGFSALLFHLLIVGLVTEAGLPVAMSWHVLTSVLFFIPVMMGILFFQARKRGNSGFSLEGIVVYRRKLSLSGTVLWTTGRLVATAMIFAALQPLTDLLADWFAWWPQMVNHYEGEFSSSTIAVTLALHLIFTGIAVPLTEEMYYRGYLLPRMPAAFGKAGPVVHSALFAIHHLHSPWMVVVRTLGLLPLIYTTRHTRSLVPGVLAHASVNTSDILSSSLRHLNT